jgi:tetratricopeptide (TPR) repeat protein
VTPFQRNEPAPTPQRLAYILELLGELEDIPQKQERARILSRAGEECRLAGRYSDARAHLRDALELARQTGNRQVEVTTLIRLATTLQYSGRYPEAVSLFEQSLALAREIGWQEDFALQHYGKCLVELGRVEEGIAHFRQALEMRQERGDEGLVESSRRAIKGAQELLRPRSAQNSDLNNL